MPGLFEDRATTAARVCGDFLLRKARTAAKVDATGHIDDTSVFAVPVSRLIIIRELDCTI